MKRSVIAIILIILIALLVSSSTSCVRELEPVTIGGVPCEVYIPMYIADEKGFFEANGLSVTMKVYETGLAGLNAVANGEMDLTATGEFPIVGKAFQKENISIIASVSKGFSWYVIGRKDRGIENFSDLEGKRVALLRQGMGEFYLGRFLDLHGMSMGDVIPVNTNPSQWVDVISSGSVDAVVVWQPYIDQIKARLGSGAIVWPVQENQPAFSVVSGRTDWVTQHPETVKRFLKALKQAEEFITSHPSEAKDIIRERLNYDDSYIAAIWSNLNFSLSLDLSLIAAMDDEARWMISNNLTSEKVAPNFKEYIYVDGLKAVKPDAVNIIR